MAKISMVILNTNIPVGLKIEGGDGHPFSLYKMQDCRKQWDSRLKTERFYKAISFIFNDYFLFRVGTNEQNITQRDLSDRGVCHAGLFTHSGSGEPLY